MKARLPGNLNKDRTNSMQNLAAQAKKMQGEMDKAAAELEEKKYSATSGGNTVKVVTNGKMELVSIDIKKEVVDPEDIEMLSDLIMAAANESLRKASIEKDEVMSNLSEGLNIPGLI